MFDHMNTLINVLGCLFFTSVVIIVFYKALRDFIADMFEGD